MDRSDTGKKKKKKKKNKKKKKIFMAHVILSHSPGRSYFLKLMTGKVTVFWYVTPCNLVELQ